MIYIGGFIRKAVTNVVGNNTAVPGRHQVLVIPLEIAVTTGAGARAMKKNNNLTRTLIKVVNTVAICTFGIAALRE